MTAPHREHLLEGGLEPTAADSLVDLEALLGLLPCGEEPVILMGDLNARIGTRVPEVVDHPPRMSPDLLVEARGRALLELAGRHGLFVVNGVSEEAAHATRPSASSPDGAGSGGVPACWPGDDSAGVGAITVDLLGEDCGGVAAPSAVLDPGKGSAATVATSGDVAAPLLRPGTVLDYCLASRPAYELLHEARVCDSLPGSDHVPVHVALRLPSPTYQPPPPREFTMRWEPGTEETWTARATEEGFIAAAQAALGIPDPSVASVTFEELCIGACRDIGILRRPKAHNPNQDCKHMAEWFDAACRSALTAER